MTIRDDVLALSAELGADPMLVQGAGGNVSWKDGSTLWIKASGTWLADARVDDIFVPVELDAARVEERPPAAAGALRPSIETMMHALMPQRVVVHVHAIDAIAHLLGGTLGPTVERRGAPTTWSVVPYAKPGKALADEIRTCARTGVDSVFLQNHGWLLAGEDVRSLRTALEAWRDCLRIEARPVDSGSTVARPPAPPGFSYTQDDAVAALAFDPHLRQALETAWALYPDHVVFLGERPCRATQVGGGAPYAIVDGVGVLVADGCSRNVHAMLRCYVDVVSRIGDLDACRTLSANDVGQLLNWDAEKHRMAMSR